MSSSTQTAVTIIDEGNPVATVEWWASDDPTTPQFAAEEFTAYVSAMTNADLPVTERDDERSPENAASAVLITADQADIDVSDDLLDAASEALVDRDADAYTVCSTVDGTALAGTTHRGTLYAVYTLLEQCGVRFYAPDFEFYDGHHERVPERDSLAIELGTVVEKPDVTYRRKYVEEGVSHTTDTLISMIDWMAKTRHNVFVCPSDYRNFGITKWKDWRSDLVPELDRRDLLVEIGGHGFDSFLPPNEYASDYPEWFVSDCNVFNIADDGAVDEYVENVLDYLEAHPEIDIFDVWPPDVATWPDKVVDAFGSTANAYAYLVNRLVAGIEERDLDTTVEVIAYQSHLEVPSPEFMYDSSVIVDFAAIDRSYANAIDDPDDERNAEYLDVLRRWREDFDGTMGLYEYYRKYSWHSLPVVLPDLVGHELPVYAAVGLDGVGIYSEPADWLTYELTHLIVATLAWDTDRNTDSYVEQYLEDRYGPAAGSMSEYFRLVEDTGRMLFDSFEGSLDDLDAVEQALENYENARDLLSSARDDVTDRSSQALLIDRLLGNLDYSIADLEIARSQLKGDHTAEALAKHHFEEALLSCRFQGTVLQSRFAINRYTALDVPSKARLTNLEYREQW